MEQARAAKRYNANFVAVYAPRVITRCDPQDVLHLTPLIVKAEEEQEIDEHGQVPDYVWYVLYEFANTRQYGYVLFSRAFSRFEWYESQNGL